MRIFVVFIRTIDDEKSGISPIYHSRAMFYPFLIPVTIRIFDQPNGFQRESGAGI
jgi:hypothetical protein